MEEAAAVAEMKGFHEQGFQGHPERDPGDNDQAFSEEAVEVTLAESLEPFDNKKEQRDDEQGEGEGFGAFADFAADFLLGNLGAVGGPGLQGGAGFVEAG